MIYARQSRDLRGEAAAVTRQIELCAAKVTAIGGVSVLDPIVDNDTSATDGKERTGYVELIRLVRSGEVDTVVAYHLDRLLRSLTEMQDLIKIAEQTGVKIVTVVGDLDLSTDMGRLMGRILASIAQGEGERKARRQRDANLQGALAGRLPANAGFGHPRNVRVDGEKVPVPAEKIALERAAVIAAYDQLFAGSATSRIATVLNENGFRTTRGGLWDHNTVRSMLCHPANAAIRTFKGERIGVGDWEPIITEETLEAAIGVLTDPGRRKNGSAPSSARRWIGGGLYLCGRCGESDMFANYRMHKVRVYRCRKHRHNQRVAEPIDDFVLETVADRLDRDDVIKLLVGPEDVDRAPALRLEAAGLRRRIEQLGVDYAAEDLTAAQVRVATERFEGRLEEIRRERAEIGRRSSLVRLLDAEDRAQQFLDDDLDGQRATIAALCTVTLLPNPRARWGLMSDTVKIEFTERD